MMRLRNLGGLITMLGGGLLLYVSVHNQLTAYHPTADYRHYMIAAGILGALGVVGGFIVAIDFPRGGVRVTDKPRKTMSKRTKEEVRIYLTILLLPTVVPAALGFAFGSPRFGAAVHAGGVGAIIGAFCCLASFYRPSPVTQHLDDKYGPRNAYRR